MGGLDGMLEGTKRRAIDHAQRVGDLDALATGVRDILATARRISSDARNSEGQRRIAAQVVERLAGLDIDQDFHR